MNRDWKRNNIKVCSEQMNRLFKNSLLIIIAGSFILAACGRTSSCRGRYIASDTTGTPVITFQELEHDFGTIKSGENVGHIFSFTNTGDADLIISAAHASCGCTVTKYSKKPVSPQGSGTVEVNFDSAGKMGKQTKTVVVQSNAENKMVILRIIADVKSEETN